MTTSSRRLSKRGKLSKNNHTPGKTKGGYCVRPNDHGIATKSNPYKGQGLKGATANAYDTQWARYKAAKGNEVSAAKARNTENDHAKQR